MVDMLSTKDGFCIRRSGTLKLTATSLFKKNYKHFQACGMKIIKNDTLSILFRVFGHKGGDVLSVAVLAGFSLDDTGRLLDEADMWDRATSALGRGQVLDLAMPKPRGEVLVLGKCFAPREKRLRRPKPPSGLALSRNRSTWWETVFAKQADSI